jgi:hypothetical protein
MAPTALTGLRKKLATNRLPRLSQASVQTRTPVIRRVTSLMALLALPSLALAAPPPAMAAPQASCSEVYFFGAHGVNEGSAGTKPNTAHWGAQVNAVWNAFVSNLDPNAAIGISANYRRSVVDLPKPWGPGLPKGPSPWATLLDQFLSLTHATSTGASALAGQMWNTYLACPDSSFVVAGYSQGAWAVDRALRLLSADGPVGKAVLADVKGVFLMGDPAWANATPHQLGIASAFGEGYKNEAAYLANGIRESRFFSICAGADPICDWVGKSGLKKSIGAHISAYTTGSPSAAADGGNWLAGQLGSAG